MKDAKPNKTGPENANVGPTGLRRRVIVPAATPHFHQKWQKCS